MLTDVFIRQPKPDELNSVRTLVQTIADETFEYLFAPCPVPIGDQDWSLGWVAVADKKIVGVVLTRQEWISDLWVVQESRRQGVGESLLTHGEAEIARRGHDTFRLRVVKSNTRAVQFYLRRGWGIAREFPHEKFNHAMLEMVKSNRSMDDARTPFAIRRYRPSDGEAVWNLHVSALEAVGALAKDPEARDLNADLHAIESVYLNSGGEFLVGLVGDLIVAMGALKRLSGSVAEITRMRVHPQYWRQGYGETILHRLQAAASDLGYKELWLDTLPIQIAAQKLYLKNGFQEYLRAYIVGYKASEAILFRKVR